MKKRRWLEKSLVAMIASMTMLTTIIPAQAFAAQDIGTGQNVRAIDPAGVLQEDSLELSDELLAQGAENGPDLIDGSNYTAVQEFAPLETEVKYKDGIYQGTGQGHHSMVTVEITVENSVITNITVIDQNETTSFWQAAAEIIASFIGLSSEEDVQAVDTITGATMSSVAIRYAVYEAMGKAVDSGIFDSGKGTWDNPYMINTAEQLQDFADAVDHGNTYEGQYIRLGNNIDLSSIENWNPIGVEGKSNDADNLQKCFCGDFDGAGCTISGMTITGTYEGEPKSEANLGLFSFLGKTAYVHDVNMQNVNIDVQAKEGSELTIRAGAITGDTGRYSGARRTARIDSCSASGEVKVTGQSRQCFGGGIAGRIFTYGAIYNCYSDADVYVSAKDSYNAAYAGGITGFTGNETILWNCYADGNVTASNLTSDMKYGDSYAGGIVGIAGFWSANNVGAGNATIERQKDGATAGTNVGMITGQAAGGMMGDFNYYSTSGVLTIINADETTKTVPTLGWQPENQLLTNGELIHANQEHPGSGQGVLIQPAEGKEQSELTSEEFLSVLNRNLIVLDKTIKRDGEDAYGIRMREWKLVDGKVLPVGDYYVNKEPEASIFASGTGTEEDPFIIRTAEQLTNFAHSLTPAIDYEGYYIRLDNDLDLSGQEWDPIGTNVEVDSKYGYINFNGNFDGNFCTISGLSTGTQENRRELGFGSSRIGLFGIIGDKARVHDLDIRDVAFYTHCERSAFVGGLAGQIEGSEVEGDYHGAVIDNVTVTGNIDHVGGTGNCFVGGIAGWQFKSAVINCWTDISLSGVINKTPSHNGDLAEVGGLVGITNRGLVANSYSMGPVYGSGLRDEEQEIEGMACVSPIAGVNGGYLVNCYGEGDITAAEWCIYAGMATGWATGISKTYHIWYNQEATVTVDGRVYSPAEAIGEETGGGVSDEWGFQFLGSLVEWINPYKVSDKDWGKKVAEDLNKSFEAFPIDIATIYGLSETDSLRIWVIDDDGRAILGGDLAKVIYEKPECENVKPQEVKMKDGVWHGRSLDEAKSSTVDITVKDGEITDITVVAGDTEGKWYEEAIDRAKFKAAYGDTSEYGVGDPSKFGGGSGTKEDPYIIATEAQLRYLSKSVNEDEHWTLKYFKQTADIDLSSEEWIPIGQAIHTEINGSQEWVALNPFSGIYDGGNHTIRNMHIGTEEEPKDTCVGALFALVVGGYYSNLIPEDNQTSAEDAEVGQNWVAEIKNVNLENVDVHTTNYYRSYAAGLMGLGQNGFHLDNCGVTGTVSSYTQRDNIAYAAGFMASGLRGCVTNCWADVDVTCGTSDAYTYAGGFAPITNRVTVVNCYSLGDVYGTAGNPNKTVLGGFVGCDGGICLNCYEAGSVTCGRYSGDVGSFVGLEASISAERGCYFNTDNKIKNGDRENDATYFGYHVQGSTNRMEEAPKTAEEMTSKEFAELLNSNRDKMSAWFVELCDEMGADQRGSSEIHSIYYHNDGSDLREWSNASGKVVFGALEVSPYDINEDGQVNTEDLLIVAKHVAKIRLITDKEILKRADVNHDGKVDAKDLTLIKKNK